MASRSLDDLDSKFRVKVQELLTQAQEMGILLRVVYTLRTIAEEEEAVKKGRSKTMHSMHLPHPPENKALAVDVVPEVLLHEVNYKPESPLWWEIGAIGVKLGLRWGGQWDRVQPPQVGKVPAYFFDPGHFEAR